MEKVKPYKVAVYIGRFQPFHNGHLKVVEHALDNLADHIVFIVGSAARSISHKNPFSESQRVDLISRVMRDAEYHNFSFGCVADHGSDAEWLSNVQMEVNKAAGGYVGNGKICIVGADKDESTYYLRMFPQWANETTNDIVLSEFSLTRATSRLDATLVRDTWYRGDAPALRQMVPRPVYYHLLEMYEDKTAAYTELVKEYEYVQEYKRLWRSAPYPPIFTTVDAVVVQSGHVLVVKRGEFPGKGLYALPGGFLNQHERIVDGAVRELLEETTIKLQPEVLKKCIKHVEVFDRPERSSRGRTITHAHLFKLDDAKPLPKVRGADDAAEARWMPLSEFSISARLFFEDHWDIINTLIRFA